ncbi:MAG: phytanoyl-CoA dioxygenase family protein [Kineosporiaceae bacterium]|nr:phytanoyl-CoA dioxygenase family protein [Kineosporiaceae bacterium]
MTPIPPTTGDVHPAAPGATGWFTPADCRLDDLRALVEQATDPADYPHAEAVVSNVLIYGPSIASLAADAQRRRVVQAEVARALHDGPGVVVFSGAFPERGVLDAATVAFEAMIAEQKAAGGPAGDHFAAPGANDRVWGALDKLAVRAPEVFAAYYANDIIALVSEAWLGTNYQVTSQINVVNPGGAAQLAHRDYHLGFMSQQQALGYPAQVHRLSPLLTLQGAIAHGDMPLASGPTLLLPHSQKYPAGYVAFHQAEFAAYFEAHHAQVSLRSGDAVFLNPALFHAAGTNRTADVRRMANLLQVSSAFGRTMETVDRQAMCLALHPSLLAMAAEHGAQARPVRNVIAAAAEGYAFPTNLDHDQPLGGMAPPSQADLVRQAVAERWPREKLASALDSHRARRAGSPHL